MTFKEFAVINGFRSVKALCEFIDMERTTAWRYFQKNPDILLARISEMKNNSKIVLQSVAMKSDKR